MACEESLVEEYVLCQVHYEIFYYSCHLQFAIWCWYLYFPSISKLRNTQVQVWINLTKCWNLRPDAKYRNNLKEPYRNDKSSLHPCQSGMKCSWMAHKASFLKRSSYAIVAIIRLSCKWASVSRFLYSDWMYNTMHENVASHTYVDPNCTRAFVASFFKHANFFGAFNQKLAKWASSNWIFWFLSAWYSATSKAKSPQASASTRNGNWTCWYNISSSSGKRSLKFASSSIERDLALRLEMTPHYPLLQEIPCCVETNQNHQFLLAWRK